MGLMRVNTLLLPLFLSSALSVCSATASLAADPPLTPVADILSDRAADRLSAIEPSLVRVPALGALASRQMPVGEADDDERRGHILKPVPRMMSDPTHDASDLALDPVGNLDSAGMHPAAQAHMASSAESVTEVSSSFGSPQQGVMTLDRGYRDAMTGRPLPDHPQQ